MTHLCQVVAATTMELEPHGIGKVLRMHSTPGMSEVEACQ